MNSYEKFIVSPERLPDVMSTILQQEVPERFDRKFLTAAGIDEPNNTLYISLFQNLGLVDEDEHPTSSYRSFHRSEEDARKVIARQMREQTYTAVFEGNEKIWLLTSEEVRELFQDLMGEKKSATFVRLVTGTFMALIDFADWKNTKPEIPESPENFAVAGTGQIPEELAETIPLDQAVSPHEEFILELMNDRTHTYAYHSFASPGNGEERKQTTPAANGNMNGNGAADLVGSFQERETGTRKSGVQNNGARNNGIQENRPPLPESPGTNGHRQAEERNDDNEQPHDQQTLFIKAMIRRAILLKQMERLNEAVEAFDQIIRYADRRHSRIDPRKVISAYYNKAQLLERLEQQEEALAIYEQMIRCFASNN